MVAAQTNTENLYFWHIDKKNIKNSSKIITNSGIISALCYPALPDVFGSQILSPTSCL